MSDYHVQTSWLESSETITGAHLVEAPTAQDRQGSETHDSNGEFFHSTSLQLYELGRELCEISPSL